MKNLVTWKDIVRINDDYFEEEFAISFEDKILEKIKFPDNESDILNLLKSLEKLDVGMEPLYDCSNFFDKVREKYNLSEDVDIETYLFDDIDLPDEVCKKYDIAWLGGYINGVNI